MAIRDGLVFRVTLALVAYRATVVGRVNLDLAAGPDLVVSVDTAEILDTQDSLVSVVLLALALRLPRLIHQLLIY